MTSAPLILRSYQSPIGEIILGSFQGSLCLCMQVCNRRFDAILHRVARLLDANPEYGTSDITEAAASQLDRYFRRESQEFTLPIRLVGTEFQKLAWRELLKIPYGTTISYAEQAALIGRPKAVRAVAAANALNPIAIIVPCHRVIGSDGSLVGYAGGLRSKICVHEIEGI